MKKYVPLIFILLIVAFQGFCQNPLTFVHLSDTHVGGSTGAEDLERSVQDINTNPLVQFVIVTGDITEFGSDEELLIAKKILSGLKKPWYVIPGNHDSNWSESGANSFKRIFGNETVSFHSGGYLFLGTHSGPNMRMSPGQIPRENIVWLDSILNETPASQPIIFLNHYPMDSSLNNWYDALDLLKKKNTQLILHGHGHNNRVFNYEGIPAIMGRSNLRANKEEGGYNIGTIENGKITYTERNPVSKNENTWTSVPLAHIDFSEDASVYPRPSYDINKQWPEVRVQWQFTDKSDIGSGVAVDTKRVIASNTAGELYALDIRTGKKLWNFKTGGKIYSTPAIYKEFTVVGSTDHFIYCVETSTGKLLWKTGTHKAVVANPVIADGTVFIGGSDGIFRALDLRTGKVVWEFDEVKNFVVTTPLIFDHTIYFGSWGNEFYALDTRSGKLKWKWSNGASNRMLSSAAVHPVQSHGKIFMVAPDRYMTALDSRTGKEIWRKTDPSQRVRESMGMSEDGQIIYSKTMEGEVIGVDAAADSMRIIWNVNTALGYDIAPTAIAEKNQIVFIPSNSGVVAAASRTDGRILWKHKVSNALITGIKPVSGNKVLITTMDGKISLLTVKSVK